MGISCTSWICMGGPKWTLSINIPLFNVTTTSSLYKSYQSKKGHVKIWITHKTSRKEEEEWWTSERRQVGERPRMGRTFKWAGTANDLENSPNFLSLINDSGFRVRSSGFGVGNIGSTTPYTFRYLTRVLRVVVSVTLTSLLSTPGSSSMRVRMPVSGW